MTSLLHRPHFLATGGSSGIGLATARLAVRDGWAVTLIARDAAKLDRAAAALRREATDPDAAIQTFAADVADRAWIERTIDQATTSLGPPEIALLSAGIATPGRFEDLDPDSFERQMQVNYFGSLWSARALAGPMRDAGRGAIVFVSSGAGLVGLFGYTAYAPTKFAVRGLAEALRAEMKPHGVSIRLVFPPDTDTPQLHAEAAMKPPETKRLTAAARTLSADRVGHAIWRGAQRRGFVIAPGWEMTALSRTQSLIDPALRWWSDRVVAKARRKAMRRTDG